MPYVEVQYHPFLFTTMALCAMAELGLTAYLINAGNEHQSFPGERYRILLVLFCFMASWTMLFTATYMLWFFDRATHLLANVASSVAWLLVTALLWGTATGIMHYTRTGGNCAGQPTISRCRQSLTVEALGWAEFGLCCMAMIATSFWMYASRRVAKQASDTEATLV